MPMENLTPRIAIIIPFYNRAPFVERCIESVLSQTIQDFVAICVDDGSSDNTAIRLAEYANRDKRIVFLRQSNQGASAARNMAIRFLERLPHQIEWACFLDSDDYLEENFLNDLLFYAEKYDAEIAMSQFKALRNNNLIDSALLQENEGIHLFTSKELLLSITNQSFFPVIWAKIYRFHLIKGHYFDERLCVGEDYLYLFEVFRHSSGALLCQSHHYVYQTGNNHSSLTKGHSTPRRMISNVFASIEVLKEIWSLPKSYNPKALEQNVIDALTPNLLGLYGRCTSNRQRWASLKEELSVITNFERQNRIIKRGVPKTKYGKMVKSLFLYFRPAFYIVYRIRMLFD